MFIQANQIRRPSGASLHDWAASLDQAKAVICTQKDLVKLRLEQLGDRPLWALVIEIEILRGTERLEEVLQELAANFRQDG